MKEKDRLYVFLSDMWFKLFKEGLKKWELRGYSNLYNVDTVKIGREVELRRGYRGDGQSLFGTISDRLIVQSLDDIPPKIYDETVPLSVRNDEKVKNFLNVYQTKYTRKILFKVEVMK